MLIDTWFENEFTGVLVRHETGEDERPEEEGITSSRSSAARFVAIVRARLAS